MPSRYSDMASSIQSRSLAVIIAFVPLVFGACSGSTEPTVDDVAVVVITNEPTAPMLVGSSAQLVASAVNATGGAIPGTAFTWSTSNPALASVTAGGLVTALDAGTVTVTATTRGKSDSVSLDLRAGLTITPTGGTFNLLGGKIRLEVPAGAVSEPIDLLVRPVPSPTAHSRLVAGSAFEIAPQNINFLRLVLLTLTYPSAGIPSGLSENSLQLYELRNNFWTSIRGSSASPSSKSVTGTIFRTGIYGTVSTAVARIELAGVGNDPALFPGQAATITYKTFDALNDQLMGRTIAWVSSNNAVATVNNGVVTAIGSGTATITASVDSASASISFAVLTRPVADWSQATEWTTYQGNANHDGYVNVTIDPVIFAPQWSATIASGFPLNPVVQGAGLLFTSTNTYFGSQRAFGLDPATGAVRWTRDFGPIHGVHEPAFGGGRVYLTTSGHQDSFLYALDPATGATLFRSAYGNQWSRYYAPVIAGGRVFMAGGTYDGLYAFDATTGIQQWFASTNQYNEWTPSVRDGVVYAYTGSYTPKLEAFDAASGSSLFVIADPNFQWNGWSMHTAPVIGGENDILAAQSGRLVSFDLAGRRLRYQLAEQFTGTVAVAKGVIYVLNQGKLDARRESDGVLLWSWNPNDALMGTMVVTNNLIFLTALTTTYALDIASRRSVWTYPAAGRLSLTSSGQLLIARPDGNVTAIRVR